MEGVLSSLFLALKAAEVLRKECHGLNPALPMMAAMMAAAANDAFVSATTTTSTTTGSGNGSGNGGRPAGKENERHQPEGTTVLPPPAAGVGLKGEAMEAAAATGPGAGGDSILDDSSGSSSPGSSRECLESLAGALAELSARASDAAAGGAVAQAALAALGENPAAMLLLGERPSWSEIAAAAGFYAKELRLLCLEAPEALPASRLLERYHETLSSMVRYELKKVRVRGAPAPAPTCACV